MKKLTVDGITFETAKEAKAAEKELAAINRIRERMDVTRPAYAKVLYEKLVERDMLHTKVGEKFIEELQGYMNPKAKKEIVTDVLPEEKILEETVQPVVSEGSAVEEEVVMPEEPAVETEKNSVEKNSVEEVSVGEELAVDSVETKEAESDNSDEVLTTEEIEEEETSAEAENETPWEAEQISEEDFMPEEVAFDVNESLVESAEIAFTEEQEASEAEGISEEVDELPENDFTADDLEDSKLLENARAIKEEMHKEDLREVFFNDEDTKKTGFSLHGLLICSMVLNVLLIGTIVLLIMIFKNSDNRNILNYDRVMDQTIVTNVATPSDAE